MSNSVDDSSDVSVDDPENYATQRRLKEIFDARKEVRQTRLETEKNRNRVSKTQLDTIYRGAVEGYIQEIRPLVVSQDSDLWYKRDFGTLTTSSTYEHPGHTTVTEDYSETIELTGLQSLFKYNSPISVVFERDTVTVQFTRQQLDSMVFAADGLLDDIGLELDVEAELEPARL